MWPCPLCPASPASGGGWTLVVCGEHVPFPEAVRGACGELCSWSFSCVPSPSWQQAVPVSPRHSLTSCVTDNVTGTQASLFPREQLVPDSGLCICSLLRQESVLGCEWEHFLLPPMTAEGTPQVLGGGWSRGTRRAVVPLRSRQLPVVEVTKVRVSSRLPPGGGDEAQGSPSSQHARLLQRLARVCLLPGHKTACSE